MWVGIRSICPLFDPSKLVHSIYAFLICNPQQRFLALLLEGQGRITEEQVPGTEHNPSAASARNLLCFEFKESLSETKNPLRHSCQDGKLVEQHWEDPMFRQGSQPYRDAQLQELWGALVRGMEWSEMEKTDSCKKRNTLWEGLCSCLALSTLNTCLSALLSGTGQSAYRADGS